MPLRFSALVTAMYGVVSLLPIAWVWKTPERERGELVVGQHDEPADEHRHGVEGRFDVTLAHAAHRNQRPQHSRSTCRRR